MPYQPIIGTLGYICHEDKVLMVHRNKRSTDDHLGKYNGLGGKMESEEDVVACMKREIFEESGLTCNNCELRGTINWTGFGPKEQNWLGFIFLVTSFSGEVKKTNEEGKLVWVPRSELSSLPMWEGDKHFLPLVFDESPKIFHGYMAYNKDKVKSWQYTR